MVYWFREKFCLCFVLESSGSQSGLHLTMNCYAALRMNDLHRHTAVCANPQQGTEPGSRHKGTSRVLVTQLCVQFIQSRFLCVSCISEGGFWGGDLLLLF